MANVTVPAFDEAPDTVVGATPQSVFEFEFPFWESADILVYVDGVELAAADFSVEGFFLQNGVVVEGGYGSGEVTLNTPVSSCTVTIDRMVTGARETQFSRTSPLQMRALNADLNKQTARDQDLARRVATVETVQDGFAASVLAAASSASAAASSASAASTSASNAATSASAASTSATAAGTSATNAGTSATAAATSASGAATSATTATTKASEASTSATNAATSASGAATSATNAGNSATAAAGSATTAGNAATAAGTSATNAGTSASNAATSATDAETARAAAVAATAGKLDTTGANIGANGPALRTALELGGAALLAVGTMAGTVAAGDDARFAATGALAVKTTQAECQTAYDTLTPIHYGEPADVNVVMDFSGAATNADRAAIWEAAQAWQGSCSITGAGEIVLQWPDGLTQLDTTYVLRSPNSARLRYEASAAPDEIEVTAISVGAFAGGKATVTVTLASALPARVVANYPIGMQNIRGDNDAQSFRGALKVLTIAGDRLSFTANMFFYSAPTAPTSLTAGTDNTITRNRAIIPYAAVGWSGGSASVEGWINFQNGGKGADRWMGHVYTGSSADGTFFSLNEGASWDCMDKSVYVGGPERIFRMFNKPLLTGNRCCYGGGDHPDTAALVDSQSGGKMTLKRCSFGGATARQVLVGQGVQAELAQSFFSGGATACVENAGGKITDMALAEVWHSVRGIYTRQVGLTLLATTTNIARAVTGLAWLEGGRYQGNPTFGTGVTNQGSALPNTWYRGGWWLQSSVVEPVFSPITVGAGGTAINQITAYTATINPASVAAGSGAEQTFTVTGLVAADRIIACYPTTAHEAGLSISHARTTAANTIGITYANSTGSAIDPASKSYYIMAVSL